MTALPTQRGSPTPRSRMVGRTALALTRSQEDLGTSPMTRPSWNWLQLNSTPSARLVSDRPCDAVFLDPRLNLAIATRRFFSVEAPPVES